MHFCVEELLAMFAVIPGITWLIKDIRRFVARLYFRNEIR